MRARDMWDATKKKKKEGGVFFPPPLRVCSWKYSVAQRTVLAVTVAAAASVVFGTARTAPMTAVRTVITDTETVLQVHARRVHLLAPWVE